MTEHFLDRVIPEIRAWLPSLDEVPRDPPARSRQRPSLRAALVGTPGDPLPVIVEYKQRAPSAPDARLAPWSPLEFAKIAEAGGAQGVSVLALGPGFDGSPEAVVDVARATPLPVLWKDIVIDPRQVDAAARCDASAILLIARLEAERRTESSLRSLVERAHARGLEVLLEVHHYSEWPLALGTGADLFGVNQRDLDTLELDPVLADQSLRAGPRGVPLLAMSGIGGPVAAERFLRAGATGVLIGTGVAQAPDPPALIRALRALRVESRP